MANDVPLRPSLDAAALLQLFQRELAARLAELRRPTVLVMGYTGAGKTSLIQAICGREVVPDDRIGAGLPRTTAFDLYEGELIRFFDSKGFEPGQPEERFLEEVRRFLAELRRGPRVDDHVQLVWYTIQGPGARVTSVDRSLLGMLRPCGLRPSAGRAVLLPREVGFGKPDDGPRPSVIVALTKSDITRPDQLEAMVKVLVDDGIPRDRIVACAESDPESLRRLVELSHRLLPAAYQDAFVAAQRVHIAKKEERARLLVHAAAAAAAAAGALPIPVADSALITPLQLGLIASLALLFNEPREGLKTALMPVMAEALGVQLAGNLTKLIPGLGSVINASVAFALTEAVGTVAIRYLSARCTARLEGRPLPEFRLDPKEITGQLRRLPWPGKR